MWDRLENTTVALWVGESLWGYPFMLGLHAIGLAVVVGVFIMLDLRLLGSFKAIQISAFLPLMKLAWVGFIVNAVSGCFLFASQAYTFAESTPFILKIALIFLGGVTAAIIQRKLREPAIDQPDVSIPIRLTAAASLAIWISAIIAGRMIAYF